MNNKEELSYLVAQVQDCGCDVTDVVEMIYVENDVLVDHLIANGVTIQRWIPVTERLPHGDKVVLCYKADRGIRLGTLLDATYADGVQAFFDRDRRFAFGATHWMPLPEPPKGE